MVVRDGQVLLAIRDGETVLQATRGHWKANAHSPLELSDRFHLGSNTKAMTALLVARLVDAGVVRWDETLARAPAGGRDASAVIPR